MKKKCLLLLSGLMVVTFASAQTLSDGFQTYYGMKGIKKKVSEVRQQARLKPSLRSSEEREKIKEEIEEKREKLESSFEKFKRFKQKLDSKERKTSELNNESNNQAAKTEAESLVPGAPVPEIWSNFLASDFNEAPFFWPPDPNGDVGLSQVAVITNANLKVFEKRKVTDPPLVTPTGVSSKTAAAQFSISLEEFFLPVFRDETFSVGDPRIRYDRLTQRWFITAIEENFNLENNLIFVAVSDGDKITDETSFTYYSFPSVLRPLNPALQYAPFLDFPATGVDKFSVLIGGRDFFKSNDSAICSTVVDSILQIGYVIDKQKLLQGDLIIRTATLGLLDFDNLTFAGMYVPLGVQNDDAQATKSFFAGVSLSLNMLSLAAIQYNQNNTPVSLSRISVPVQPYNFARDVVALGSPMAIDPLDTRLLDVKIHRNKITNQASLWTAHTVGVNQKGGDVSDNDFTDQARDASRWYEVGNIYTAPTLAQLGTVYDGRYNGRRAIMYFNPSIAASGQGHAVLGGTTAAFDQYLNVFVAGRYFGDAPNTMHKPIKATESTAIYAPFDPFFGYVGRWGDFSQTVVDPWDDQTIWTFQEYANTDDSYGTRAVQLKAPPPARPVSIRLPGNIETTSFSNKANQEIVIIGRTENRSAYFDPGSDPGGPGYNRFSVKSTGGIQVTDVRVVGPTTIVCKVLTKGAAPGAYQLIITNPDGQSVTIEYTIVGDNTIVQRSTVTVNEEVASRYLSSSRVYPNPTEKDFRLVVDALNSMPAKVVVTDMNGKQVSVRTQQFSRGSNSIGLSLSSVSKGSYMVVVYNADNTVIAAHKIVKQ
jgi:hypothetical protein